MKLEMDRRIKAKQKGGEGGLGITGLRAQWAGGDMAGVKAPQDMCRGGFEG